MNIVRNEGRNVEFNFSSSMGSIVIHETEGKQVIRRSDKRENRDK